MIVFLIILFFKIFFISTSVSFFIPEKTFFFVVFSSFK